MSLHPDEQDAVTLWAEIHRLRCAAQGPDGFATWQDAATSERIRRVQADAELARLRAACADLRGGIYAGRSALALVQAECERLRVALRFYARGEHFIVSDCTAWDTVSGEPQNWQCDESGTATIEDGSIAAAVLRGEAMPLDEDDMPQPIEGERAALTGPEK